MTKKIPTKQAKADIDFTVVVRRDSELVEQIARFLTGTIAALLDDDDEIIKWMSSV